MLLIVSNYVWLVKPNYKESVLIVHMFKGILKSSGKSSKLWTEKDSTFCNSENSKVLKENDISNYSTEYEGDQWLLNY